MQFSGKAIRGAISIDVSVGMSIGMSVGFPVGGTAVGLGCCNSFVVVPLAQVTGELPSRERLEDEDAEDVA